MTDILAFYDGLPPEGKAAMMRMYRKIAAIIWHPHSREVLFQAEPGTDGHSQEAEAYVKMRDFIMDAVRAGLFTREEAYQMAQTEARDMCVVRGKYTRRLTWPV